MGLTRIRVRVRRDSSSRVERETECLVDSGAVHSVVPKDVLKALGIKPYKSVTFILANGETVDRPLGTAHFVYKTHEGGAPVVFGDKGDAALLGATNLEAMGLALNRLTRDLYPRQMTLMGDVSMWMPGPLGSMSARRQRSG